MIKQPFLTKRIFIIASLIGMVSARGEEGVDAAALRRELEGMRGEYERRIEGLERRIRELEGGSVGGKVAGGGRVEDPVIAAALAREAAAEAKAKAERESREAALARFRADTEIRDIARRADAEAALAERIEDVLEGYLDITGYFRAGYGRSDEGGPQRAFGIPGVAKYRLGNETENYGELAFAKTFYPSGMFAGGAGLSAGDPVARMTYRLAFVDSYQDYGSASDTDFSSPELWGSLANVLPGMPDAKVWAGNRYYRRHDIHVNDFYFWDMSGGGAGVEDIPLGPGKLAVAWIGDGAESSIYSRVAVPDPDNLAGFSKTNLDVRFYDWAWLGGSGEIGLSYASARSGVDADGRDAADADGLAFGLVWTDKGFLDANSLHKVSVQAGNGPAKTFSSGFETFRNAAGTFIRPDPEESWRLRVTDQVVVRPAPWFSLGSAAVFQHTDFGEGAPDQQWLSGGVRPVWQVSEHVGIAFEAGVDWVSDVLDGSGRSGALGKLTLAPQVALGGEFFSRPVLRAFVTYAAWSDGLEQSVGGADYRGRDSGWSWGVQMESWW